MKIIIAGGGTGGHLFPGIAIAEEVKKHEPDSEILFVVNSGELPFTTLKRYGIKYRTISAGKLARSSFRQLIGAGILSTGGFLRSLEIIKSFTPDVIVGMGSYVSGPVVMGGILLKKITVIHEQNYIPGLATRFLSRFVDEVEVSFPETGAFLHSHNINVPGNPVRKSILAADRTASIINLGISRDRANLAVFGGSRGASTINRAVCSALREIKNSPEGKILAVSWQVLHITGKDDYQWVVKEYESAGIKADVFPFVENMENIYGAADLVVCRAGGNTVAELTAAGLPAIYVPYPWASANHQEYNARWVCERQGGLMIPDNELGSVKFRNCLAGLMVDEHKREKLAAGSKRLGKHDSAEFIVKRIRSLYQKQQRIL